MLNRPLSEQELVNTIRNAEELLRQARERRLRDTIDDQREKIDEQSETIRQLGVVLNGAPVRFPVKWKLQPGEANLLRSLMSSPDGFRDYGQLCGRIISMATGRSNINHMSLKTFLCRIRKKIPKNIVITTRWGEGLYIDPESKRILLALSSSK